MIAELARVHGVELSAARSAAWPAQMVQSVLKLGLDRGGDVADRRRVQADARRLRGRRGRAGRDHGLPDAGLRQGVHRVLPPGPVVGAGWNRRGGAPPVRAEQPDRVPPGLRQAGRATGCSRRFMPGTSTGPAHGPEGGPMKLFPDDHETITGTARRLRPGEITCVEVLQIVPGPDRRAGADGAGLGPRGPRRGPGPGACPRRRAAGRPRPRAAARDSDRGQGHHRRAGPAHRMRRPAGKETADPVDATIVARLREAGAIILGKTVTTAYAWIDPPVTRNPWNLDRTPGGSSSGSAAAVACGMCLARHRHADRRLDHPARVVLRRRGNETDLRVRRRPGHLSARPEPRSPRADRPFGGRSAADLRGMSPVRSAAPNRMPRGYEAPSTVLACPGRYGIFDSLASSEMRATLSSALECLGDAGAEVCDFGATRLFEPMLRDHRIIMAAEAAAVAPRAGRREAAGLPSADSRVVARG